MSTSFSGEHGCKGRCAGKRRGYIHSVQLWVPFLIFFRGCWSDAMLGVADMMDDQVPNVCLQRCRLKRPTDEVDELFRKQDEGEEGASRMVNGEW